MNRSDLIVIESPNKVIKLRELTGAFVTPTLGHFLDLPKDRLGVDLKDYYPHFEKVGGKPDIAADLSGRAKGKTVYIATDPDREGYAIGTMVHRVVAKVASQVFRLEIHEITAKGVAEALRNARPFAQTNKGLYDAFLGRRVGDRLAGYLLTPVACRAIGRGHSVGRVQSPAVRLLVDREREIRDFKAAPFWNVTVRLAKDGLEFQARHVSADIPDEAQARAILERVTPASSAKVMGVKREEKVSLARPPFTTSSLQMAASTRLGFSPEQTMQLAQRLFEAGLITYHRTDSVRVSDEFIAEARTHIRTAYGIDYLPKKPTRHVSKNSQADAHEAIRPTHVHALGESAARVETEKLSPEHVRLYELIVLRALASQMSPARYHATSARFDVAGEGFQAAGRVLMFDGYLRLWGGEDAESGTDASDDGRFPDFVRGQMLAKTGQDLAKGMTRPPARFSEASLIKKLEDLGLGRPSTYAQVMGTIKKRGYAEIAKGRIAPTPHGEALIDWLYATHPWLIDYAFTAEMEAFLDDVEAGKADWREFCRRLHERIGRNADGEFEGSQGRIEVKPPSEKQVALARQIAQRKGIELPEDTLNDHRRMRTFIDKHISAKGQTRPAKSGKSHTANSASLPAKGRPGGNQPPQPAPVGGQSGRPAILGRCPECGQGEVVEWPKNYVCANCGFRIWKNSYGGSIGVRLARELLTQGRTSSEVSLKARNGKPYKARLTLENGRVAPLFEDRR